MTQGALIRAVVCDRLGPPEVLRIEARPRQPLGAGEVRVAVRAAALNFPDVLMVAGGYQFKPPLPFTPGTEAAGEVLEVGAEVRGWQPGARVIVRMRHGAFAEEVVVPPEQLQPMPPAFSFEEAAGFLVAYGTAFHALQDRGRLQAGEALLVHGAAGGVGLAAVDVGRMLGARVLATARGAEKQALLRARGAELVLDPEQGFREPVLEATGGAGADVIYDPVGGDVFAQSLRCIAWRGRLLVVGFASGTIPEVPLNYPLLKGCSVIGLRAGEYGRRDPEKARRNMAALLQLAGAGTLRPHISHRLPLAEVVAGMRLIARRAVLGKAVLLTG